ncbi:MAG: glycine cleavage system aminomethyltransferase GcvT [Bacteroidales bacterium]|nr:glycine cleavage system aminomethyltransferase GcvT [Bacteroidales bacterium]
MKSTVFESIHIALGARMAPFAGFNMPISYTGVNEEHLTVRERVGVFDVSHMGEIYVRGPQALALVQRVTTNDASILPCGKAQYSCMPNGHGGIVDDILVYHCREDEYLLVVNASNTDKDEAWLREQNTVGAVIENVSDQVSQLAVQGPRALDVLQALTKADLQSMPSYTFLHAPVAGVPDVLVSRTGYTGNDGFELYFANEAGPALWNALFEEGYRYGIQPIGLGARDTLRLEMGFCLYGNDIDDTTSPIEAGLGWITRFVPDKDFIDRDLLYEQKAQGVKRRLVGLRMTDKGIPRHGFPITDAEGRPVGQVTSGTMSPCLKEGIAMGYVEVPHDVPGSEVCIEIRGRLLRAAVVRKPFVRL